MQFIKFKFNNNDAEIFILLTLFLIFCLLSAINLPISFDEAKFYLVARKCADGVQLWKDIHGGSNSSLFYFVHGLWYKIFGPGYFTARTFNVAINLIAFLFFLKFGINFISKNSIFKYLFFFLFMVNPFVVDHIVEISHASLSGALLIIGFTFFINLLNNDYKHRERIRFLMIFLTAFFITLSIAIRSHLGLLLFLFPILYFKLKDSDKKSKFIIFYLFGIISGLIISEYQIFSQIIVTMYYQNWSLLPNQISESFKYFLIGHRFYELLQLLSAFHSFFQKFNQPYELSQAIDLNRFMNQPIISKFTLFDATNACIKQFFGFEIGSLIPLSLIFFTYSLYNYFFNKIKTEKFTILFSCFLFLFTPVFFLRYILVGSFSYFYQSFFFISMLACIGIEQFISSKYFTRTFYQEIGKGAVLIIALISLQNLITIKPSRFSDNPFQSIYKQLGYRENKRIDSIYNLKFLASKLNSLTGKDDLVLLGYQGITPYINATVVSGTEMNQFKIFFAKENWNLRLREDSNFGTGASPFYIVNELIKKQKIKAIVDDGYIHQDLINEIKKTYCVAYADELYRIFHICK